MLREHCLVQFAMSLAVPENKHFNRQRAAEGSCRHVKVYGYGPNRPERERIAPRTQSMQQLILCAHSGEGPSEKATASDMIIVPGPVANARET